MKLIVHADETCPSCGAPMLTIYWFKQGLTFKALHNAGPDKWEKWAIGIKIQCRSETCGYGITRK
jgi:hypothetical protein